MASRSVVCDTCEKFLGVVCGVKESKEPIKIPCENCRNKKTNGGGLN